MRNIFISYNRQSEDIVKTLAQDLEDLGYEVWYDHEISGGQVWWDQILEQIRSCRVFLFVTDQKSLDSTACKREYTYAAELGKVILPILVSDEVSVNLLPPELSKLQFVDYRTYDTKAVIRLARALTGLPPEAPLPDPLPAPPEIPISYLGNLIKQIETSSTLNYAEQSALLVEVKRSFRDPATTKDARKLLLSFRKRPDLFATVADEIDELLEQEEKSDTVQRTKQYQENKAGIDKKKEDIKEEDNKEPLTLEKILVGTWSVQISQFMAQSLSASFIFNANGTFSGQVYSNMGNMPVYGQWNASLQQLSLRGTQTVAYINYPYSADITFMNVQNNRLEGTSQAGESIVMTR